MFDEFGVEVVFVRQGELEHDGLAGGQTVELVEDGRFEQLFGPDFARAVNVDFRLDDRHAARGDDLPSDRELLAHDVLDTGLVRLLDERGYLGSEDALRGGLFVWPGKRG